VKTSLHGIQDFLFAAVIVTLPWIGVGLVKQLLRVDTGAGVQPAYALMALLVLVMILGGRWSPVLQSQDPHWRRLWLLSFMTIGLSGLGLLLYPANLGGQDLFQRFLRQLIQYAVMVVFVWMTVWWLSQPGKRDRLLRWLAIGVILQFFYSLLMAVDFYHPFALMRSLESVFTSNPSILAGSEELYLGNAFTGIPRVRGTACEPLYLGNYLLMVLPLLLYAVRRNRQYLWPLGMAAVMLIGTWSRGAWLAAAGAAILPVILLLRSGDRRPTLKSTLILLAIAAGLAVTLWLAGALDILLLPVRRILQSLNSSDWSNLTRLYSMQAGWRAFLLSPIVGIGWGQFAFHFPLLVDPMGLQSQFSWPVVNNYPLMVLCETGLAGFAVLAYAALTLFKRVRRQLGEGGRVDDRIFTIACLTAFGGVWLQLLTFSQYNLPHIWISLGVLLAATRSIEPVAPKSKGEAS
jgi:O-antigen ligase